MSGDNLVGLIVALALLGYLGFGLMFPERL